MNIAVKTMTTVRDYLKVIFRYKILIIAIFIVTNITVDRLLKLRTPFYQASVKMVITGIKTSDSKYYKPVYLGQTILEYQSNFIQSSAVIERVVKALELYKRPLDYEANFTNRTKAALIRLRLRSFERELDKMSPEQKAAFYFENAINNLRSNLSVDVDNITGVITVIVSDFDPQMAAVIANSVSRSFVIYDLEQQLTDLRRIYGEQHANILQTKQYIEEFQKYLDGKPMNNPEAIGTGTARILEQAEVPGSPAPFKPSAKSARFLAFIMSIAVGVILAFILEYMNPTFKSSREIESFLNIPFLGSVPRIRSKEKLLINGGNNHNSKLMQSYAFISNQIWLIMKDRNLKSILIPDMENPEDTAIVIANIGIYLSKEAGHKVLIIDANLRDPVISKLFNLSGSPGLDDILEGRISFTDAIHDAGDNLHILPTREAALNPAILVRSSMMSDIIQKAKEYFEIVLVSSPDLKNFTDSQILASLSDYIAFVVNEGGIHRHVAKRIIEPLEEKMPNAVGVILNNQRHVIPEMIYKLT
jgi:capsular exopolysaccharide synthesis family protein